MCLEYLPNLSLSYSPPRPQGSLYESGPELWRWLDHRLGFHGERPPEGCER
jgi:hypothetical protein